MSEELKPCPFCGFDADLDEPDTLYPGGRWREDDGIRHYLLPNDKREGHGRTWTLHCPVTVGGCGAQISGDTREEAIAAWDRRADSLAASHQRLKEALEEVMATVENEKNGRIWAADLLTCFYTREAFDNAREALRGAP